MTIYTPRTVYRWTEADHNLLRKAWRTRRTAVAPFDRAFARALSLECGKTVSANVVRNKRCTHHLTTRSLVAPRLAGFSVEELRAEILSREVAP